LSIAQIPSEVKWFLIKSFVLLIIWKSLYLFILQPIRQPDFFLTKQTAEVCGFFIQELGVAENVSVIHYGKGSGNKKIVEIGKSVIYTNGRHVIGIEDPCNALELYVLYVGFIACFATTFKKSIAFIIFGCVAIYILNIARCTALAWIYLDHYSFFDFSHHYLFTTIVYVLIFILWAWYTKRNN
jgi:exosortase/archaeosortase family protein